MLKAKFRRLLRKRGYDVVRYLPASHDIARRMHLLESFGIQMVLDVGANTGQYATHLRESGYVGEITSFEPLSTAFSILQHNAREDSRWKAVNLAIGDTNGSMEMNVSRNSVSSSFLEMLPAHLQSAPDSVYVSREVVEVRTMDSVVEKYCPEGVRTYLKVDAQGFELKVLTGAEKSLDKITGIQIEMSLVPLFKGGATIGQMIGYLEERGYCLMSVEPGFCDETTGQLLQVDGVFFRQKV
jgi:FkbM family methyltransferase